MGALGGCHRVVGSRAPDVTRHITSRGAHFQGMHLRAFLLGAALLVPRAALADDCPDPYASACYADPTCDQYCEPEVAAAAYAEPVLAPVPPTMRASDYIANARTGPYDARIDPMQFSGLRSVYASHAQADRSAYFQGSLENGSPWAARHLPWYVNGDRVDSCDEYIYERWYDYSLFEDDVTLYGDDYRTIFEQSSAALADGVASKTGGFVANAPAGPAHAPKNAFFLLDPSYPEGTEALQYAWSATAQELFPRLAAGADAYTHTIWWHRSMSDQLQQYGDDLLYALAEKQREFTALVAQRDAVMKRWRDFDHAVPGAASVCELPPETPVTQWPFDDIWDPFVEQMRGWDLAQYYNPGAFDGMVLDAPLALQALVEPGAGVYVSPVMRLALAAQDPVLQPQLSRLNVSNWTQLDTEIGLYPENFGTCSDFRGVDGLPNRTVLGCDEIAAAYECRPLLRDAVADRLAALDAQIDAALQHVAPYGCLAYDVAIGVDLDDEPHLVASACDWNPGMYVHEMSARFGARREEDYRDCVRVTGASVWPDSHTIRHPSWIQPTQDFTASSDQVLVYLALAKQKASEIPFGTDADGNAIAGHSAQDSSVMGTDMFGLAYDYDAEWGVTGLPTAASMCEAGVFAFAHAQVGARILTADIDLLLLDARISNEPGTTTVRQSSRTLEMYVLDQKVLAESTAPEGVSPALTFHIAKEASSEVTPVDTRIPVAGFFVHVRAGVAGRVGLTFDTAVDVAGAACESATTTLRGTVSPWTSLDVFLSGGLDIAVVEIGLRVDLTLLHLSLPFQLDFTIAPKGGELWLSAKPRLSLKLKALSGRVRAYVDFPFADPLYLTLFTWDGIDLAEHVLFAPTWDYALEHINIGLTLGNP
jgi:hypothetical protein